MTGAAGGRASVWQRAWGRFVEGLNWRFRRWQYVFVFDPSTIPPRAPPDLRFERYERVEDVPRPLGEEIARHADATTLEWDLREVADHAVYWVAFLGREPVAKQLTRQGGMFRRWFVPLGEGDLVFFRGWARSEFRGRGIVPALIRHIIARELPSDAHAYTDCRVFNKSSIHMIEKAGFRRIATVRSLTREQALGTSPSGAR